MQTSFKYGPLLCYRLCQGSTVCRVVLPFPVLLKVAHLWTGDLVPSIATLARMVKCRALRVQHLRHTRHVMHIGERERERARTSGLKIVFHLGNSTVHITCRSTRRMLFNYLRMAQFKLGGSKTKDEVTRNFVLPWVWKFSECLGILTCSFENPTRQQ